MSNYRKITIERIRLIDLDLDAYACNKKYVNKHKDEKCFDPIKNDICTYKALQLRIFRHKELYKNVVIEKCIIKEGD